MGSDDRDDQDVHGLPETGTPAEPSDTPETLVGAPGAPPLERELTVIEMMNGPARPDEQLRKTVLWLALAFASMLLALTFGVVAINGVHVLELVSILVLGALVLGMIGALRHKGVDPMAQFDPPPADRRRGRRPNNGK